MELSIGTFNLNNLFSRFNFRFRAEVDGLEEGAVDITAVRTLADPEDQRVVTYEGRVVKKKPAAARKKIAERIRSIDVDVLAVQEVEDIDTLRYFARNELGAPGLYPNVVLIEGNDPRLIDLAVLSKYPIGAATSWQHAVHPDEPKDRVFSRDLLEVEILDHARRKRLCTVLQQPPQEPLRALLRGPGGRGGRRQRASTATGRDGGEDREGPHQAQQRLRRARRHERPPPAPTHWRPWWPTPALNWSTAWLSPPRPGR
jgi:hypothetical protein